MNQLFSLLGITLLLACSNVKNSNENVLNSNNQSFKIKITFSESYCNGAAPSEETMEELNKPKPATQKKVYLRKGDSNDINKPIDYTFTTNDNGIIEGEIPEGKYSIVLGDKKNQAKFDHLVKLYGEGTADQAPIDQECLKKHFSTPEAVLTVKKDGENHASIHYKTKCPWTKVPCSDYKGGIPPSAPPKNNK
ncbi:MAG: hypothetical protein WEA99_13435 [Brumimicrobium sp.]